MVRLQLWLLLKKVACYMRQICTWKNFVLSPVVQALSILLKSLTENIKNVAAKMNRNVDEITLVMLDRERHHGLMKERDPWCTYIC